ncbi:hypothetical protein, partial [Ralstonia pseudosolanacearum]|uniref:hypothetical protein n=1 Tax=Ralstonia pseudosolanacearum TaxID=1310165 RepID=UPI001E440676
LALVSRAALRAAAFSCLLVPFIQYGGTHREFKLIHAESIGISCTQCEAVRMLQMAGFGVRFAGAVRRAQ